MEAFWNILIKAFFLLLAVAVIVALYHFGAYIFGLIHQGI